MLGISDNGRFLVYDDGKPFFYLGDTAWLLFHRLTREEANLYLENRAGKGFTVIQAVVIAEPGGLKAPNAHGEYIFPENDITKSNEAYFRHIDYVVDKAASLGLHIGMLPAWGNKVGINYWGEGPANFINEGNARAYGRFLGERYASKPIIWVLGGDRPGDCNEGIWREMAVGLKEGDGGEHLITYHPSPYQPSSTLFHNEDWLNFNMIQSGHHAFRDNYREISSDYSRRPVKPCMDGEPGYEDHPNGFDPGRGYLDDFNCRVSAYWALMAGAHGHTYGCHDIWQFFNPERYSPISWARTPWREALDLPGSFQMIHARNLLESRPYLTRIPDQSPIRSGQRFDIGHIRATRDGTKGEADASYLMVYFPSHHEVTIDTGYIASGRVIQWWYNPRTGEAQHVGEYANPGKTNFTPPTTYMEQDWILVLDNAYSGYPTPGKSLLAR